MASHCFPAVIIVSFFCPPVTVWNGPAHCVSHYNQRENAVIQVFVAITVVCASICNFNYCLAQELAESAEGAVRDSENKEAASTVESTTNSADPALLNGEAESDPKGILAGHSFHGEVFNEGPRQMATKLPGMGAVNFQVTTTIPEAQEFFNQGVAQLHGFWYFESERSFRQVARLDPTCAMAYWGMAMSNMENEKRAKAFIAEAVKLRDGISPREQGYIDAINSFLTADEKTDKKQRATKLAEDLESLVTDFPDDIEAKAFLITQYWQNSKYGLSVQSHNGIDALLEDVFDAQPNHPAHHYRIHLWDSKKPKKALASAAACGPSAPGIAHMWHMPGHIYSHLGRFSDGAWQQEASARVDHQHMMRYQVLPDKIHNFAHNNEWLVRNLMNVGRVSDAMDLAKNMIELPQHPSCNLVTRGGSSASFGRARLLDVLNTYEMWDELIRLADSPYLQPTDNRNDQVKRLESMGIAQFQLGNIKEGDSLVGELTVMVAEWEIKQQAAFDAATAAATAEGKEPAAVEEAGKNARQTDEHGIKEAKEAIDILVGFAMVANGDIASGYEKLKDASSVNEVLQHRIQFMAGKTEEAIEAARKHADSNSNKVLPLAGLVEILWMADRRDEAITAFKKLWTISEKIDLQAPIFARLTEIARTLEWGDDWRVAATNPGDLGERPDLDSLGPFRWEPSPAATFDLPDVNGSRRSLQQFDGRPVVVVFYLGHGCLHCAEQLKAIVPMAAEFEKNGISLIAISTDDAEKLKNSVADFSDVAFPFPLVADPDLEIFRKYRAYDDFEQQPLHGTFAIDGHGKVIWHDVSYEPFMDIRFVLDEMLRQRKLDEFRTIEQVPLLQSSSGN